MKPITEKQDAKLLETLLAYLEGGGVPSIPFVQKFFLKYDIDQVAFLAYLKQWGSKIVIARLRQTKLLP